MARLGDVMSALRKEETALESQLRRVRDAISALGGSGGLGSPRGRRKMMRKAAKRTRAFTAAQKKEISRRMKAYWAKRRKAKG